MASELNNSTNLYLGAIALKHKIESDYALAKLLNVTRAAISKYRAGKSQMDEKVAARAAALLGMHPMVLIANINAERAIDPALQKMWRLMGKLAHRASKQIAMLLILLQAFCIGKPQVAVATEIEAREVPSNIYYVKCRQLLDALLWWLCAPLAALASLSHAHPRV